MQGYLSVIIPSYNEEEIIEKTYMRIDEILRNAQIEYELIFIDDGSQDDTWGKIQQLSAEASCVRGVRFSRNFGKESAIMAGLQASEGDCSVVLDCDLQHPPEKIVEMYHLWQEGYEVIEGQKSNRGKESVFHSLAAHSFYSLISRATGFDMQNASDYKLLDRKAVLVLINMSERSVFFRALSSWIGFKTTTVTYEVQERSGGSSKWSTKSLIKYALSNITSFSSAPMQIITFLGVCMFLFSIVFGSFALVQKLRGVVLGGFTTVILLLLLSSSVIMISLGIIGYYIAKIYDELKGRPRYIVSENIGRKKLDR